MALVDLKSDLTWYGKPPAVNDFPDKASGAKGFTDKMDTTQYSGVARDSYTYPVTVRAKRLMQPLKSVAFPGPQNFFGDSLSGAKGFTLQMDKFPGEEKSEFLGIKGLTYTYPKTIKYYGDRLMRPLGTPRSGPLSAFPGPQNFFENTNATGFTDNMWKPGQSKKPSQFTGITEGGYQYPANLNEKFNALNIVDNSYNTTYVPQPFVVRGMQRKGKANEKPQYWGFGSKSGFDDGLIRGGAVTVADRVIADTTRIAKFMASPKGLLWIVKQAGLGLSNPKVEAIGGMFGRQTRIHTGVTSLLSVAGNPFGLHFTRHGLPFANEIASYSNVQRLHTVSANRLVKLKKDLFNYESLNVPPIPFLGLKGGKFTFNASVSQVGAPILALSGLGGPQSVYGVGITDITRRTDSGLQALRNASDLNFNPAYNAQSQYASNDSNSKYKIRTDVNHNSIYDVDTFNPTREPSEVPSLYTRLSELKTSVTPGNDKGADLSTNNSRNSDYPASPYGNYGAVVNDYITLAYNKIPKSKKGSVTNDFRNELDIKDTSKSIIGRKKDELTNYYSDKNLENKYGFGSQGITGADKTNPNSFGTIKGAEIKGSEYKGEGYILDTSFRGDKINATDIIKNAAVDDPYTGEGQKDLIRFFFEDGEKGTNLMLFRAILTGLTDSFSPGWDKVDIMGRPDGAYLYTSFERTVSFNFTVAATSRAEMIPLWRKLNYLATYTMPNLSTANSPTGRASGPFMRITVGDMYNRVPGFISSLSYTVPDESSWDIAEDRKNDSGGKQLPMVIEVAMSYTIISDYRPQLNGRAFSTDEWLTDALPTI
jgi:hypothetical protein